MINYFDYVGNKETETIDETTMLIHSKTKSISQDSMVDKGCQTDVEIDLNNNTVVKTNSVKSFSCQYCNKSFNSKFTLKEHINAEHLQLKLSSCQYCEKSFAKKGDLRKHINAVHLQALTCQYCEKSFDRKDHISPEYV